MIKFENVGLASPEQMEFIIQGMRNPMNSWEKSDSDTDPDFYSLENIEIGSADHSLMQRLSDAGTEHRKYMRMINIMVKDSPLMGKNLIHIRLVPLQTLAAQCIKLRRKNFHWRIFRVSILVYLFRLKKMMALRITRIYG